MWGSQSTLNNGRAKISTSRFRKINQNSGNSSSIFPLLKFISCSSETYGLVLFSPADLFSFQSIFPPWGMSLLCFHDDLSDLTDEREKKSVSTCFCSSSGLEILSHCSHSRYFPFWGRWQFLIRGSFGSERTGEKVSIFMTIQIWWREKRGGAPILLKLTWRDSLL